MRFDAPLRISSMRELRGQSWPRVVVLIVTFTSRRYSVGTYRVGARMMTKLKLWLFIAGRGAQSQRAIENLRAFCESTLSGAAYEVEVIDVLEQPDRAEADRVLATPTLIKRTEPIRRLIGDLGDREKVLRGLDLEQLGQQG